MKFHFRPPVSARALIELSWNLVVAWPDGRNFTARARETLGIRRPAGSM
jgi:hypothetical protein